MSPATSWSLGPRAASGWPCAEAFAARGDTVTGVDARPRELGAATARDARARGGHRISALDAVRPERHRAVHTAAERLGPVDVLVNAAGIYPATPSSR